MGCTRRIQDVSEATGMSCVLLEDYPGWVSEGRCSGECCRLITLNVEPESIAIMAAHGYEDARFVAKHFIPVRLRYEDGITGIRWHGAKPKMQYRCAMWTGSKCGAYDDRPMLCRSYGIEKRCHRADCTLRPYPLFIDLGRWDDDGGMVQRDIESSLTPP